MLKSAECSGFRDTTIRLILCLCSALILVSCAGNGVGLDENGNPIGNDDMNEPPPTAFEPTFTNIQRNVFSAICTDCHSGPFASQGLRLNPADSYNNLVNVPSQQRPELFRVQPGDPNLSYLIHKLEGGPNIFGTQMPQGRNPLPQDVVNAIRVWIERGALDD